MKALSQSFAKTEAKSRPGAGNVSWRKIFFLTGEFYFPHEGKNKALPRKRQCWAIKNDICKIIRILAPYKPFIFENHE